MTEFSSKDLARGRFLRSFMGLEPLSVELAPTVEDVAVPAHAAPTSPRATVAPSLPKTRPTRRPKVLEPHAAFAKNGTEPGSR